MTANQPVHEFNVGRVKAAFWENGGEDGQWYTVRFSRLYKKDETWKSTPRFKRDDLASLAEAAARAQVWIDEQARAAVRPSPDGTEAARR
jgi:hypothetical protein